MAGQTLPEKVAQIYYTYGLFCSSYPFIAIGFALSVVLICCYPLLNVPLPGNIPTVIHVPIKYDDNAVNGNNVIIGCNGCDKSDTNYFNMDVIQNETLKLPYVWTKDKPLMYVQQIIIKTAVSPWSDNLIMWDAFRAPLQEVFRLLETIRNHEDPETKNTLSNLCYQVDGVSRDSTGDTVMPEYTCLILSPANLWRQNIQAFSLDNNIVNTVYFYQSIRQGKVSMAESAFGMQMRDTGVKRYPLRSRSRVLQFALTVFYRQIDQKFLNSLAAKLKDQYPLHQGAQHDVSEATIIYYPGEFNYKELIPLTITYFGLFLYVYFSVRKIEYIKSKLGLAACSVLTIAASLSMSMGICHYFGFALTLQGKEIFPYLVVIVGLENALVLTKSVTSTDTRLDVKIRLAQGLSKEGWSITKNILTEITILTLGFFTFVPFIQEFSIFMIISLLSDFFIQMAFFATILGVDVRRVESFGERNPRLHLKEYFDSTSLSWRWREGSVQRMTKSRSQPRLNGHHPADVVAQRSGSPRRVPKRIRLVNLWARTRFFQRAFMLWMLVWISMIVYNSGIVDYFVVNGEKDTSSSRAETMNTQRDSYQSVNKNSLPLMPPIELTDSTPTDANDTLLLKHSKHGRSWARVSPYHWFSILSQYNASLSGRYLVWLPPMLLSHRVTPELAAGVRNPQEREPAPLRWQALALALDPIDITDYDVQEKSGQWGKTTTELPIYPTTPMEILLLAILCSISVAVIAYMMVVLYRCVCSRNYAEWRTSWNEKEEYLKIIAKQPAVQLVMEAVPVVVSGHGHEVECLVTDGEKVVSSCLQGTLKVWDPQNGELITNIDRNAYIKLQKELETKMHSKTKSIDNKTASDPPDVTPKSKHEVHRPLKGLTNHLNNIKFGQTSQERDSQRYSDLENTKYDFAKSYREVYCSDNRDTPKDNIIASSNDHANGDLFVFNTSGLRKRNKTKMAIGNTDGASVQWTHNTLDESPIWCMDLSDDLIIIGCADGRLEFWEANKGKLVCVWRGEGTSGRSRGITHVRAVCGARRVVTASLSGRLTLLRLDAYNLTAGVSVDWRFSTAHRRTHKRTGSTGSISNVRCSQNNTKTRDYSFELDSSDGEEVQCVRLASCRPHQQPVTELHSEGGRILTGCQDHVLKVFSSDDLSPLLTLHGHCGPVTSCFIDHATPTIAGSGSQDGLLCVWDLHTGACLYSMQAHDGAVTSLAYTASYVISAGADERLCVWDRFQGHLLNSLHVGLNYMSRMLPLTHSLLLMGDRGGMVVYDLSSGEVLRRVLLGQSDGCVFVRQILPLKDAVVCDYANQLRIVRFPLVSKLSDFKSE